MKNTINLAAKRKAPNILHKRILTISFVFFCAMFLISAGLIGYRLILTGELASLKSEEARLISVVNADPEKKIKYLTVRERLLEIQKIIANRKDINTKISSVSDILPFDTQLSQVKGESEQITFGVSSTDLASLDQLVENKINEYIENEKREIKRVEMVSFRLNNETLLYEVTFDVEFNDGKAN